MMFAILFGLSMDYNVFLLSRVHEAYNEGDRPRASVIHGMERIGKVILFAALIMSAVFLAFVTTPDIISKMFGVGLGLAILIDVLLVRLVFDGGFCDGSFLLTSHLSPLLGLHKQEHRKQRRDHVPAADDRVRHPEPAPRLLEPLDDVRGLER
jgi:hypothetical protein